MIFKGIPVIVTGILFFVFDADIRADASLAVGLFAEENWSACRIESLRVLQAEPENESAGLFAVLSALRLGLPAEAELKKFVSDAKDRELMAAASYEYGRLAWSRGDQISAFLHLKKTFETTGSYDLYLRSGCSLSLLLDEEKSLREKDAALALQLKTSRFLWNKEMVSECRLPEAKEKLLYLPGKWMVAFYRTQINPAIGARCSLTPSCSEYFRQACRAHGLLGFAIQADRFFREPSEVAAKKTPVLTGGVIKYADPLEDHTGWLDP